ncbi:uncharacterized protein [Argopecten irradians]|uniref:uncharacterized protein isoform X3 n=1 Tax=Argopecten irradians TaxID=31199 RepID=UPI0037103429
MNTRHLISGTSITAILGRSTSRLVTFTISHDLPDFYKQLLAKKLYSTKDRPDFYKHQLAEKVNSTKEIADGMAGCSIGDNDNGNGDEAKDKAAEPRRTVKPVQETTSQQVDKEPNKGDVSQNQSNPKTSACSKQSTSQTTGPVDWQFYLDTLAPHLIYRPG